MIKDREGAYSQLVRLQEGANETENTRAFETDKASFDFERSGSQIRSGSQRLSFRRSISRGSSGSRRSIALSFGLPGPINFPESEERYIEDNSIKNDVDPKMRQKVSIKRLANLNKPEIPVLLIGSVAAIIHGVLFPVFGLILSSSIEMFYKPPNELKKDSEFWSLMFLGMGCIGLVAAPAQNFFFGVAGAKLIQRIRSMTFEKIVHQEISWFDDPVNSRCDKNVATII